MSESNTRTVLIQATPTLDPWPIESKKTLPGIPDYSCAYSDVELKCQRRWPSKSTTLVKLKHPLSQVQFDTLCARWKKGVRPTYVLLQINRLEWLLFAAPDSSVLMRGHEVTREELSTRALIHWKKGLPSNEITYWLSRTWQYIEDIRAGQQDSLRRSRFREAVDAVMEKHGPLLATLHDEGTTVEKQLRAIKGQSIFITIANIAGVRLAIARIGGSFSLAESRWYPPDREWVFIQTRRVLTLDNVRRFHGYHFSQVVLDNRIGELSEQEQRSLDDLCSRIRPEAYL